MDRAGRSIYCRAAHRRKPAMTLSALLGGLAERCRRHAVPVLLFALLLGTSCGLLAWDRLGVTTDTDRLFANSLPWRQRALAFERAFPQFRDLLVGVVQAQEPEEAEATAVALAQAMAAQPALFRQVRRPNSSPWFDRNALLFLNARPLQSLLDRTIDAQPFLGQLVADPSARGLFAALTLVAMGVERGAADPAAFAPALRQFDRTLAQALDGHPQPLSWESLLAGPLVAEAGPYSFVLARPTLDYAALQPGGRPTAAMRQIAAGLPYVQSGQARVRITGSVALADEEFATVAHGALAGLAGSLVLVVVWLFCAVRSWRLVLPILLTLVLGLLLTTGFAAAAVGTLNLVSVAFAVLFIGIAVDFSIQFSVRYRSERQRNPPPEQALARTGERVGPQVLVAAAATAAGFLAFVPTAFAGVAELGLIAGVGMILAFLCTMTVLPAALSLCRPRGEAAEVGFAWGGAVERGLRRVRLPMLAVFAALALAGAALLPRVTFDSDPLHTKDPHTEAMRTLHDLMSYPLTNPYSADILAPSLAAADAAAARLRALPLAAQVLTLSSFVPAEQPRKLAIVADAANILMPTLTPPSPAAPVTPADVRAAAKVAHDAIAGVLGKLAPDDPLRALDSDLARLATAPDAAVMAANEALVRFLPGQLARLRTALQAGPVTAADVPPVVAQDWVLPDGTARVQVIAKPEADDSAGLHRFAAEVRAIAPDAVGSGVTIVDTAATIVGAFRTAAVAALLAITVILGLALRRVPDVLLVLAPLLLSGLLTAIVVVLLPLPLNFANIIALPLLLGVGVSFNIYFVMNWRAGAGAFLGTATARAVMFSALTTGTAFGSLALSRHPGTASMGDLLLISLACTLAASLLFIPTLLVGLRSGAGPG
jgi:hopanoid biosynthesis associated RND transporter like protein HpnN